MLAATAAKSEEKKKKRGFKIMPLRLWLGFSIIGYKYEALEGNYCEI